MNRTLLFFLVFLAPHLAFAEAPDDTHEIYAQPTFVRTLVGFGSASTQPYSPNMVLTAEVGHRPFYGALTTGAGVTTTGDLNGQYTIITPSAFVKLDLTYIFCSHFWAQRPNPNLFLHAHIGSRVGLSVSDSFGVRPSYLLIRPELGPFVDIDIPLDQRTKTFTLVVRGEVDTSVSIVDPIGFRWSLLIGISYGWGHV